MASAPYVIKIHFIIMPTVRIQIWIIRLKLWLLYNHVEIVRTRKITFRAFKRHWVIITSMKYKLTVDTKTELTK
jgi:hypothetical protein